MKFHFSLCPSTPPTRRACGALAGQMDQPRLIAIVGPTASGKSQLAIKIASRINGEIISADSMQLYRYMDIGTGKASPKDRGRIPHHLIDIIFPDETFSAANYKERARGIINALRKTGKNILIVGGTGLYIKVLLRGLFPSTEADQSFRQELREKAHYLGRTFLWQELQEVDPVSASRLHPNDTVRIIRALEVYRQTGIPLSHWQKEHSFGDRPYEVLKVGLMREREDISCRIENRVDHMVREGFEEEVKSLLNMGYDRHLKSMRGLGYKRMVEYVFGERDFEGAIHLIKQETKAYAKRQLTWFRSDPEVRWVRYPQGEERIMEIVERFVGRERSKPSTVKAAING
jgi:tRNA dimethylallyltransferase